jgi:hypothetical protein
VRHSLSQVNADSRLFLLPLVNGLFRPCLLYYWYLPSFLGPCICTIALYTESWSVLWVWPLCLVQSFRPVQLPKRLNVTFFHLSGFETLSHHEAMLRRTRVREGGPIYPLYHRIYSRIYTHVYTHLIFKDRVSRDKITNSVFRRFDLPGSACFRSISSSHSSTCWAEDVIPIALPMLVQMFWQRNRSFTTNLWRVMPPLYSLSSSCAPTFVSGEEE